MRQIQTIVIDDIDGKSPATTTEIVIDGEKFTVDLSKKHKADLRRALKRYTDAAQNSGKPAARAVAAAANPEVRKAENAKIRSWAKDHGVKVPQRGRLPKSVVDQFEEWESKRTVVG